MKLFLKENKHFEIYANHCLLKEGDEHMFTLMLVALLGTTPVIRYMVRTNKKETRIRYKTCSKITIRPPGLIGINPIRCPFC